MAPDFSPQQKMVKGALLAVGFDSALSATDSNRSVFVFQYNPDKLTRTFSYLDKEETQKSLEKSLFVRGPPTEIICLTLELDAADKLEQPEKNQSTIDNGLYPQLSALESIMYPPRGFKDQTELPVALFFWGPKRIMPVCLMSMHVLEENFDRNLNPIRVKVDLCMRVLPLSELKEGSLGFAICRNNLRLKETLAMLHLQQSLDSEYFKQVLLEISKNASVKKPQLRKTQIKK